MLFYGSVGRRGRFYGPLLSSAAVVVPTDPVGTQVFLTATGDGEWVVPAGWGSVQVDLIAAGGNGSPIAEGLAGTGGGGGQYQQRPVLPVTPGATHSYHVGTPGGARGTAAAPGAGDCWFSDAATIAYAQAGQVGKFNSGTRTGGNAAAIGACIAYNGGDALVADFSSWSASGGGGSGGPSGAGKNGGAAGPSGGYNGGGGGGSNGGSSTAGTAASASGGNSPGGHGTSGTGGGATLGAAGTLGGGGAGGASLSTGGADRPGGAGGVQPLWDGQYGPSGGGGGGGNHGALGINKGGAGGTYGGGAGGNGYNGTAPAATGGQGIIVITKLGGVTHTAPTNVEAPVIQGEVAIGSTVTAYPGLWFNATSYSYVWKRDGTPISGATASTYLLDVLDTDTTLTCTVTATNGLGSSSATSDDFFPGLAYRYLRAKVVTAPGAYIGSAAVEFMLDGVEQTGGTAIADSNYPGLVPSNAYDHNASTDWACNGTGTAAYIGKDFGAGNKKAINSVAITTRSGGNYGQQASAWSFDGSDDGVTWVQLWASPTGLVFSSDERKVFNKP